MNSFASSIILEEWVRHQVNKEVNVDKRCAGRGLDPPVQPDGRRLEAGQGLTEYALILVLVAVVVIVVLAILGPAVGNVFSNIVVAIQANGVISSVSAERTGYGTGNDVVVTVNVSTNTLVTARDSQSGASQSTQCNGSCTLTLTGVGHNAGKVTVTAAAGGAVTTSYGVQH